MAVTATSLIGFLLTRDALPFGMNKYKFWLLQEYNNCVELSDRINPHSVYRTV